MVDNGPDGVINADDEVTLTYTVTNTGNTCLREVGVDDPSGGTLQCTAKYSGAEPTQLASREVQWDEHGNKNSAIRRKC